MAILLGTVDRCFRRRLLRFSYSRLEQTIDPYDTFVMYPMPFRADGHLISVHYIGTLYRRYLATHIAGWELDDDPGTP